MGNEKSQPTGLVIEENAIEVTDRWSLHSASYSGISNNPKISVFVGPTPSAQNTQNLLEKFIKNLMIYRHPSILKYVVSWQKSGKLYLATESIKPLVQVLTNQTALQVCIGLQNILKALIFLHDKAESSHNNVCRAAVYVTQDGSWKLGGLEYLCRFSELSSGYLNTNRVGRYDGGISPSEQDRMPQPPCSVDCFAFGVLAEEVLSAYSPDDVPGMQEFKDICKHRLQNTLPSSRPQLNTLLNLTFFSHEFIRIHNFLTELTLKTNVEKQEFFRDLPHKLNMFDEEIVASQLGTLLLSRMVLLDTTAQQHLLPSIFAPRVNSDSHDVSTIRMFTEKTFKTHLVPKLLPMFCVRDAHVRLILLSHFSLFCSMFSSTHLKDNILPELLVGIKDTNDTLVSSTLRALADIVPILGSSVVIGGKSRGKIFADGRPKAASSRSLPKNNHTSRNIRLNKHADNDPGGSDVCLPERASPDGGEDFNSPIYTASEEETENWTDWENTGDDVYSNQDKTSSVKDLSIEPVDKTTNSNDSEITTAKTNNNFYSNPKNVLPDITTLDIKLSKTNNSNNELRKSSNGKSSNTVNSDVDTSRDIDFFQDMEPVIISSYKHNVNDLLSSQIVTESKSKFEITDQNLSMNELEGWGDDDVDIDVSLANDNNCKNNDSTTVVNNDLLIN